MGSVVKTRDEIKKMREGGKILAEILEEVKNSVKVGVSTLELDQKAEALCQKYNVKPAFKGYRGFPATLCVGRNEVVVHGVPRQDEVLEEGDIISLDMGVLHKGFYSDMAVTVGVGRIADNAEKLINVTRDCLNTAIKQAKAGNYVGDISNAIQTVAELAGFSPVRNMVGHGIGKELHEKPQIPCFGEKGEGMKLEKGMTVAIEAIINEGTWEIEFSKEDGWTTTTKDGKLSGLFEHTVLITDAQAEVLTCKS